jgi:hypothetical protein
VYCFGPPLAFSFFGAAQLGRADRDEMDEVFDFTKASADSVKSLPLENFRNLQDYAAAFSASVFDALSKRVQRGNIILPEIPSTSPRGRGYTIVEIGVDGYHKGLPGRVTIRFYHENQKLREPEIITSALEQGLFYGIEGIANRLLNRDPLLDHYLNLIELDDSYSEAAAEWASFSRAFIAACAGPEGALVNPKASLNIGGHIHIASVTVAEGFRWIPGFKAIMS